jgi:hypothetical protein
MDDKKKFWKSMLSDSKTGEISSKRVIGFLGFLFLSAAMIISLFSIATNQPSNELIDAVQYITIASLFGSTIEKFTNYKNNKQE